MSWTCKRHGSVQGPKESCPECVKWYAGLPDPAGMTPDARLEELEIHMGQTTVAFSIIHARIEALAGGPVWTHQLVETEWLRQAVINRSVGDSPGETAIEQLVNRVGADRVIPIEVMP